MSNDGMHHITPFSTYLKVCLALFVLTILTVVFHEMHLGALAAPVAFLIASIKAALVILIFMHLKYDSLINKVIFGVAFFFVFLLFLFSALDIFTRIPVSNTL
jgi:cytochrome c oxidase subunit 4